MNVTSNVSEEMREMRVAEKPPVTVQNDVEKKDVNKEVTEDVKKEATGIANAQTQDKLTMASNNAQQPQQQIQDKAQNQISKGYVDVRV